MIWIKLEPQAPDNGLTKRRTPWDEPYQLRPPSADAAGSFHPTERGVRCHKRFRGRPTPRLRRSRSVRHRLSCRVRRIAIHNLAAGRGTKVEPARSSRRESGSLDRGVIAFDLTAAATGYARRFRCLPSDLPFTKFFKKLRNPSPCHATTAPETLGSFLLRPEPWRW